MESRCTHLTPQAHVDVGGEGGVEATSILRWEPGMMSPETGESQKGTPDTVAASAYGRPDFSSLPCRQGGTAGRQGWQGGWQGLGAPLLSARLRAKVMAPRGSFWGKVTSNERV